MPQTIPFTCRWSDSGVGVTWVHVAGGLDPETSSQLEATLLEAQIKAQTVVLDLRGVTSVDSGGAHAVVDAGARARRLDRRLIVVRGAPDVDRALTLTQLGGGLELFDVDARARPRSFTRAHEMAGAQA
jgi:anti-anti-sigma factor